MRFVKQLTKYTLLILSSLFAVFSVFGFFIDNTSSKWYGIILLLLFCLPMFYFGLKIKIEPKLPKVIKHKPTKEIKPVPLKIIEPITETIPEIVLSTEEKEFNERVINFRYTSQMLQGKIYQTLETIDIMESTKNLDTLISRFDFLITIYDDLKIGSVHLNYKRDFQNSLDKYKQMYYDKTPTQNQLNAIVNPLKFDLITFYYISVYQCFVRCYEFQNQVIETLKTEKGKQGRFIKLLENLYLAKNIVEPEIEINQNAKLIYDKLLEVELVLKAKII
ncbi:TPA: hypothetical protein ACT5CJ_001988 [Flavobacterium psychrophilum]